MLHIGRELSTSHWHGLVEISPDFDTNLAASKENPRLLNHLALWKPLDCTPLGLALVTPEFWTVSRARDRGRLDNFALLGGLTRYEPICLA